jgi:hypothetical protein
MQCQLILSHFAGQDNQPHHCPMLQHQCDFWEHFWELQLDYVIWCLSGVIEMFVPNCLTFAFAEQEMSFARKIRRKTKV